MSDDSQIKKCFKLAVRGGDCKVCEYFDIPTLCYPVMEEVACIFQSEERTEAMNKEIMKDAGFEKEVHRTMAGLCPFCDNKPTEKDFRNEVSLREFKISGLCQECQDKVFGTD